MDASLSDEIESVYENLAFLNLSTCAKFKLFSVHLWFPKYSVNLWCLSLQSISSIRPFVTKMESKLRDGTWTPVMRCPRDTPPTSHQGETTPLILLPLAPIGRRPSPHSRIPAADTILMVILKYRSGIVDMTNIPLLSTGSLPPSPADSGVSDVDPSSSSHNSDDENRLHRHRHAMGE